MNNRSNLWEGWWRWPLIPVAVILTLFLVAFAIETFLWLQYKLTGYNHGTGWFKQYILPTVKIAILGYSLVKVGCIVAPRGKVIVGVIISTTIAILGIFFWSKLGIALLSSSNITSMSFFDILWLVIFTIAFLGASIYAIIEVNEVENSD